MITSTERFPPTEGKNLYAIVGLRASESMMRKMGIHSSGGYIRRKPNQAGTYLCRPIYDWSDGDVWKAIRDNRLDYNSAYDVMVKFGMPAQALRIAPPTLTAVSVKHLNIAMKAWPKWFDRVCRRVQGIRTAAMFGRRAVEPNRKAGESWEETFQRECVDNAPDWIKGRAVLAREYYIHQHKAHSTEPLPQKTQCKRCGQSSSWEWLAKILYNGDPFAMKIQCLKAIEPEFFRAGTGKWGGKPTW